MLKDKACKILFSVIAWLCMLYSPATMDIMATQQPTAATILALDRKQSGKLHVSEKGVEVAGYSICEMTQQYGALMPEKPAHHMPVRSFADPDDMDTLHVFQA